MECLTGRELSEPRLSPDARRLAWVESDVLGARIVVRDLDDETRKIESPWTVRAGRSLGGGCFEWMPNPRVPGASVIVAVTKDGDVCSWDVGSGLESVIIAAGERTLSSPVPNSDGTRIAYVVDQREIHVIDVESLSDRRVDHDDHAFTFDPIWWRDLVVWQAWSPPHMPWDESCLVSEVGVVEQAIDTQYQQPQSTPDGTTLGWLDDSSGWLNVVVDGRRIDEILEHAGPTWGERQRSWCFDSSGRRIAFVRNEGGFGRLCSFDRDSGDVVERAKAVHGQVSWRGDVLAAVRTGGRTPTQIVVYDTSKDEWSRTVIEIGSEYGWGESTALVEPELIRVRLEDSTDLHARLYKSPSSSAVSSKGTAQSRRLLCWIHGGPTDQWQVSFMPRFAYWIDRGFDILVPDHRGSTGHGRTYTQALRGRWGERDVDDVRSILDEVRTRFGYTSDSTAVLGSSAGGLTALGIGARHCDLVSAVVVAYPVTDIAALDESTHRFEAHYNRSLVGSVDETIRLSAQRSPLAHVESLARLPVLVFHGTNDPVVPIEQSRNLVDSLRLHGAEVEFVTFEGEGHGFRNLENKIAEFTRTEVFLERHLVDGNRT